MTLITLICSIISACAAVFNMVTSLKNSVADVSVTHTYENDGKRAFLRIQIKNNSDFSIKVTSLIIKTEKGILHTSNGTVYFSPFDSPYVLLDHESVRYGYQVPVEDLVKEISITFSKRVSTLSHRKIIVLD